jgi:putative NIF3 family GTP cyclohydrolase 1 type 2
MEGTGPFGDYKGQAAGVIGSLPRALPFDRFVARVEEVLGKPVTGSWPFGDQSVRRVAIVSGSAGSLVDQAAASGADVYLTGEVSHSAYHQALELKMNVVYGGHYATETAGLKALAGHLAGEFPLQTVFLDLPTGT